MASITSALPEHLRTWIEQEVESGHYESEEIVITTAVERMMRESYRWEEDEDLLEAIAEADRGDVVEWTEDLFQKLSDQARENARLAHKVSDDTKY